MSPLTILKRFFLCFFIMFSFFRSTYIQPSYAALEMKNFSQQPIVQNLPLQTFQITPIISDITLVPGQQSAILYQIHNLSDAPLGIHADLSSPIAFSNPSTQRDIPNGTSLLLSWTHIDNPDILLGPKQNTIITVRIFPPSNITNHGYAETVFFTPIVDYSHLPKQPVVLSRIGGLVLATVGTLDYTQLEKKVRISSFYPSSFISRTSPLQLLFTVDNAYFTYLTAKPFLTITPLFDKAKTMTLTEHHVLPGISRQWKENYTPSWSIFYTADLAVSIGEGKQLHARTFFVFIPQWFLYTCFALLICLCLLILLKLLKNPGRMKKSVSILFKGE